MAADERSIKRLVSLSGGDIERKTITFKNIEYTVKISKDEEKKIVRDVSGEVKAGKVLYILGPSGCGKTSLIHILSNRITSTSSGSHQVAGSVLVDGQKISDTEFRRMSGLVTQEDIFNSCLTVFETFYFTAALKLGNIDKDQQLSRIEEVITALQMEKCRDTYIGDDANPYLKGISGGEKRRLAIGMEVLDVGISILMLDEPTSGLDAAAAQNIANLLRSLADQGMVIVAALHQPRASIMSKCDDMLIMAEGRAMYYGPLKEYVSYLKNHLKITIPELESPYDILLDALNPAIADETVVIQGFDKNSEASLADALHAQFMDYSRSSAVAIEDSQNVIAFCVDPTMYENVSHWIYVTYVLLYRTSLIKLRDPICLATQMSTAVIMGLIFGCLYYDVYNKSNENFAILDAQMCIVMTVLMCVWLPYDVTLTFPMERRIFLRERKAGLYPTSAFYVARVTADAPAHIISAIIMALIVWGMAGLQIHLAAFVLLMIVGILVGAAMMQMIGAMARTFEEANIYMMIILMMSMMLGTGFVREVPVWLDWARDISVMGVLSDMAMYLEFKNPPSSITFTSEQIYVDYGVLVQDKSEFDMACVVIFLIFVVCRILCYLFVKFLFTGRTLEENWKD